MESTKKSIFRKFLDNLPTLIVIIITFSAFLGGLLQNNFVEQSKELEIESDRLKNITGEIQNTAKRIYAQELEAFYNAREKLDDAASLMLDYVNRLPSLSIPEAQSILNQVSFLYSIADQFVVDSWSWALVLRFDINEEKSFLFDFYPEYNFSYDMTKDHYDTFDLPIDFLDASDFLNNELVVNGILTTGEEGAIADLLNNNFLPIIFVQINFENFLNILNDPLTSLNEQAQSQRQQAEAAEANANSIIARLSLIIVASVLAIAMTKRIYDKQVEHQVSKIQSMITDGKIVVVSPNDILSNLILILALLITIFGLYNPINQFFGLATGGS